MVVVCGTSGASGNCRLPKTKEQSLVLIVFRSWPPFVLDYEQNFIKDKLSKNVSELRVRFMISRGSFHVLH